MWQTVTDATGRGARVDVLGAVLLAAALLVVLLVLGAAAIAATIALTTAGGLDEPGPSY